MLAILLGGCATQTRTLVHIVPSDLPQRHELASTAFFPQELYQCGPAALATILQSAGIPVIPDQLVAQVYLPERQGSLQTEMIAAGRRNGALALTIPPRLDALLREVAGGNPVVVLQNLSLPVKPMWHYAVVIGYDLDRAEVILRSGTTERLVLPMSTFEHTWKRSDYWGMVALAPGRLPLTVDETLAVPALVALEKAVDPARAWRAYQSGLQRWPHNLLLQLGAGNSAYASGRLEDAATAFRAAIAAHPGSAPAYNNLATVLAELRDFDGARDAAQRAVAIGGEWRESAQATLDQIERKRAAASR